MDRRQAEAHVMARLPGLKSALRASASRISETNLVSDSRVTAYEAGRSELVGLRDDVRAVLPGHDEAVIGAIVGDLAKLSGLARAVRGRMVDMGRALLRLQETAGAGGYKTLFDAKLVPVHPNLAGKLRQIARAVDGELLPEERLPASLEAAFVAARLDPPAIQRLLSAKVLRPEATARELREATQPSRAEQDQGPLTPRQRKAIEHRLERLRAEVRRLEIRLERR